MSLEDSPPPPRSTLEVGEHIVEVDTGIMSDITPQLHVANHYGFPLYYYVQLIPPNPIAKTQEHMIIHFGPISRRNEFAPRPT